MYFYNLNIYKGKISHILFVMNNQKILLIYYLLKGHKNYLINITML